MLDDMRELAGEIQKLTQQGSFDPFALFAGQARFHSLFLAPFSPALQEGRERLLADGTGPLAHIAELFQRQGASAADAMQSAQAMFRAAQGMCVVVMLNDQGLDTIPQLFFGHLEDAYLEQVVGLCGEKFPDPPALRAALGGLRQRAQAGAAFPALHAGADVDTVAYWAGLADDLIAGLDGGLAPTAAERLRDLGAWIAAAHGALERAGMAIPAESLPALLRSQALAGDIAGALARLERSIGAMDEEEMVQLLLQLGDAAVSRGQAPASAAWWERTLPALLAAYPPSYDLLLARFKVLAAAQVEPAQLVAAADALIAANKKNARHDLAREPIWRVAAAEPGELVDTAQAAELIGRSPAFVAKRLDAGTIPIHRQGDQVRIPKRGLLAWKAVVEAHRLLD
jgi:hypothetical protein